MSKHCAIMQRMKANYEIRSRSYLTRKVPVVIRLDGKAFHTYTKDLNKPFDEGLIEDIQETAIYLCENIQGAKCAYVQSDEISILITDYDTLQTDAWFDYNVQKMTSISASLATGIFNQLSLLRKCESYSSKSLSSEDISNAKLANFDSRVFNIPKEEVANYFLARQKDAVKNSISMLAQSLYSHKELHLKNSNEMQEMCFKKGHNWNDLHWSKKRGSFIVKNTYVNDILLDNDYLINPNPGEYLIYLDNQYNKLETVNDTYMLKHRWEVVETPMIFNNEVFKEFIK